ncbi:hypothetical protein QQ045_011348 [Rhodiola kirilowii]
MGKAKLLVLLADDGGKPRAGHRLVQRNQQGARGVAELKSIKFGEEVEKELRAEGISFVKIIPAGGRNLLIQFACVEYMEKCMVEDYRSVLRNFNKLKRWREEDLPTSRSIWISMLGLPFRAWTERNCERLAAPFSVFLKMDDRDVRFVGVGRARMLVEISLVERVCQKVEAEISGKLYVIRLCEDCCLGGCEIDKPQSVEVEDNSDGSIGPPGAVSSKNTAVGDKTLRGSRQAESEGRDKESYVGERREIDPSFPRGQSRGEAVRLVSAVRLTGSW